MPKPAPIKPTPATSKRSRRVLIIFGVLVAAVVLGLAGWKVYHSRQIATDKARFAQAERDIDELSRQVIAATGQPAKVETEKYCSRPNLKLDEGPLSCDIHWYGFYEISTPDQATSIYQTTKALAVQNWNGIEYQSLSRSSVDRFDAILTNDGGFDNNHFRVNGSSVIDNQIRCNHWSAFYLGDNTDYRTLFNTDKNKYVLVTELSCGDKAKIEHYPMKS